MGNTLRANALSPEATPLLEPSSADQRQTWTLPQRKVFSRPVFCVIFVHFCVAFTVISVDQNLLSFATNEEHLNLTQTGASILRYTFFGTVCITLLLGGWLADSKLGKFLVILYATFTCFIGTILLLLGSLKNIQKLEWATKALQAVYVTGLIFFAFGIGGLKPNTVLFAAEQVSNNDPAIVRSLYLWYYWVINFSYLLTFAVVLFTQRTFSIFYWNLISVCLFVLAIFVFLAGKPMYSIYPGYGNVLSTTLKVAKEAIKKSKNPLILSSFLDHWLDRAKMCFGGSFSNWEVEDVKKVYRILPILATFMIYHAIFNEMWTSMLYQGEYTDIRLGSNNVIPDAFLNELEIIAVLILIPFMDKVAYPFLEKFHICPSQLQRIGIGMLFATASMVCAGGIEWYRVDNCCILQDRGEKNLTSVSKITAFYQVPQSVFLGLCEVFSFYTAFEFTYSEAPRYIQGIVMGLYYCIIVSRNLPGTLLRSTVNAVTGAVGGSDNKWYPDKDQINNGHHLANYFFILAVLMILLFILYVFVALSFKAKKESAEQANLEHSRCAQYAEISPRSDDTSTSYDYYARHSTC